MLNFSIQGGLRFSAPLSAHFSSSKSGVMYRATQIKIRERLHKEEYFGVLLDQKLYKMKHLQL